MRHSVTAYHWSSPGFEEGMGWESTCGPADMSGLSGFCIKCPTNAFSLFPSPLADGSILNQSYSLCPKQHHHANRLLLNFPLAVAGGRGRGWGSGWELRASITSKRRLNGGKPEGGVRGRTKHTKRSILKCNAQLSSEGPFSSSSSPCFSSSSSFPSSYFLSFKAHMWTDV